MVSAKKSTGRPACPLAEPNPGYEPGNADNSCAITLQLGDKLPAFHPSVDTYKRLVRVENDKVTLDFTTISRALKAFPLPDVDHIVGIASGGIVPASLIAHQLNRPLSLIEINYRARDNSPRYPRPVLLSWQPLPVGGQRVLLSP